MPIDSFLNKRCWKILFFNYNNDDWFRQESLMVAKPKKIVLWDIGSHLYDLKVSSHKFITSLKEKMVTTNWRTTTMSWPGEKK